MIRSDTETTVKYRIWRRLYPNAMLYEFMTFVQSHWDQFFAEKHMKRPTSTQGWHDEFDAWLLAKYPGVI